jgi:hypothetical protein
VKVRDLYATRPHIEERAPSPQPPPTSCPAGDNSPQPEADGPLCSCGIPARFDDTTATGSRIYRCDRCGYAAIVPQEPGKPYTLTPEEEQWHGGFYAAVHFLRAKLTTPQPIAPLIQEWAGTQDKPTGRNLDALMEARWALNVSAYEGEDGKMWWRLPQSTLQ